MAQELTGRDTEVSGETRRRVLVTGAAGRIGSYFAMHADGKYDLRLMAREKDWGVERIRPFGELVFADLSDVERLKECCEGVDTVLHLAANPDPDAIWERLLEPNIVGVHNLFAAAKAAGVRRVIYASSIHAVDGYPASVQVKAGDPVNPLDLYGVTKCFGEALARYMATQEGMSAIVLRIGAFTTVEQARLDPDPRITSCFVSKRDLNQMIHRCIDAENIPFAILHALSDNRFKRMDISEARDLVGYAPLDDMLREDSQ